MVIACQGKSYITGHGASNYLDHSRFDSKGISIYYMDYMKNVYPQVTTTQFNPYVSALDLIANMGPEGRHVFSPQTLYWKDFKDASQDKKLF